MIRHIATIPSAVPSRVPGQVPSIVPGSASGDSPFALSDLFASSEIGGGWSVASDMFQQSDGTVAAGNGDPVGYVTDLSGNDGPITQSTTAAKPTLTVGGTTYIGIDGSDDNLTFSVPAGGIDGTICLASTDGVVFGEVSIAGSSTWNLVASSKYFPGTEIIGALLIDRTLTSEEKTSLRTYFEGLGAGSDNFASVTSMAGWIRNRSELASLDVSSWDTSLVENMSTMLYGCSNLTSLDVSGWDVGAVTTFSGFITNCSSLTSLDVSGWDVSSALIFDLFANGCSSLATLDVSGWDTSSATSFKDFIRATALTSLDISGWDTSGVTDFRRFALDASSLATVTVTGGSGSPFSDSPCTNYTDAFTGTNLSQSSIDDILVAIAAAGTSNGTFDQSGGNAPSATGEAAIDTLRGRGWTVSVTGGY